EADLARNGQEARRGILLRATARVERSSRRARLLEVRDPGRSALRDRAAEQRVVLPHLLLEVQEMLGERQGRRWLWRRSGGPLFLADLRSEEHTSELHAH